MSSIRWPAGPNPIINVSTADENKHSATNSCIYMFFDAHFFSHFSLVLPVFPVAPLTVLQIN